MAFVPALLATAVGVQWPQHYVSLTHILEVSHVTSIPPLLTFATSKLLAGRVTAVNKRISHSSMALTHKVNARTGLDPSID